MFINLRNVGLVLVSLSMLSGCSTNQTVKNAWKATRGTWYTYVNKPAVVNYDETGEMDAYETSLAARMIGIDVQWQNLERTMSNADKPPTEEWLKGFFAKFPWVGGFAGVNADGDIIGRAGLNIPLDFSPLLEADKKQNIHALRGLVQQTPAGPQIIVATPLYKDTEFLGVVAAYFDMRSLLQFCTNPEELIIMSPEAVLWSGKFNVESSPLSKMKWAEVLPKNSSGKVSDGQSSFFWVNRYLGNQPIIFAVQVTDSKPNKEEKLAAVASSLGQEVSPPVNLPTTFMPMISEPVLESPPIISHGDISAPSPINRSPAPSPINRSPVPSPIHKVSPTTQSTEIDPAPKTEADIDAGSSRSMLRPPSPIHKAPASRSSSSYGKLPEVNLPE